MVKSHIHGMQHYHYTNINHGHTINDPGHGHSIGFYYYSDAGSSVIINSIPGVANSGLETKFSNVDNKTTGISVNGTGDDHKLSSGALANAQWAGRTETDSNDNNAQENRPSNFTARLWKRIA